MGEWLKHRCAVCGAPAGEATAPDTPFLCKEHQKEKESGK